MAQKPLQLQKDSILLKSMNCLPSVFNENLRKFIRKINVPAWRSPNETIRGIPQTAGPHASRQTGDSTRAPVQRTSPSCPLLPNSIEGGFGTPERGFGTQRGPCTLPRWTKEETHRLKHTFSFLLTCLLLPLLSFRAAQRQCRNQLFLLL